MKTLALTASLGFVLLPLAARAEQTPPVRKADPAVAPAPAPAPAPSGEFKIKTDINMPPDEMVKTATKSLEGMRAALARAMEVLAKARESKDIIRLNCVNEKLTPMKGILKIAEDALIGLQENIATGNIEAASYEYSKIKISDQKVSTLLVQAINCVGAEATYVGDTNVEVDIDPDMVGDDPYYGDPQILVDPSDSTVDPEPEEAEVGDPPPVTTNPPIASPYN